MKDSILKGTGNSRFLKSAVPAGTSWADALAMLQAGTFPIDFNGINTEGFQQVGTPLNKANLLKDATAAQIGLPPSTTPDGMFQALGNTGELHVWRKTVKTSSDTPAGYTLGTAQSNLHVPTSGQTVDFVYSASITVGNDGTVSQPSSGTKRAFATSAYVSAVQSVLAGKFFTVKNDYGSVIDGVWYCPSSLTVSVSDNDIILSQAQKVNAHGIISAGTTTTYPVSTNPNAYQEGSDAKEAGYTLGEVVSGTISVCPSTSSEAGWRYTSNQGSIVVSDAGEVSLSDDDTSMLYANSVSASPFDVLRGKYVKCPKINADLSDMIVYFPRDVVFSLEEVSPFRIIVNKYQPVTGYPAIPAGTTIEYLGKLGDKARVQVLSYVGTGTYGESNPNSVTANFPIKLLAVLAKTLKNSNGNFSTRIDYNNQYKEDPFMVGAILTTNYTLGSGCGYKEDVYNTAYGKKSEDGKTFSWYTTGSNSARQFNESGYTYIVLLIG